MFRLFTNISRFKHQFRTYYTVRKRETSSKYENVISKQLQSRIKATGPITVADYMREVLVNPLAGYYMHKDMLGSNGDFITSPELSQMFGEMIAVWCLNEWSKSGSPKPFQIVELGPGKGTLSKDILRVFSKFNSLNNATLSLVEVSPFLSNAQSRILCSQANNVQDTSCSYYKEGVGFYGVPVRWFRSFQDVPDVFSIVLAHEFFDALPIHKFVKTEDGYREILIDIAENEGEFRYIIARNETPGSKLYITPGETREHLEISPESILLVQKIATKLEEFGGLGLIADYGYSGEKTDTFRAFKKHKLHNPLLEPGTADLTADVDFNMLKQAALEGDKVLVFGPETQRNFLLKMGIEHRFKALKTGGGQSLDFGYEMMISPDQMGERFKFMCMLPSVLKVILDKYPVAGF